MLRDGRGAARGGRVSRNLASDASSGGQSADRRRQRAGFSIFVDQVVDQAGGQRWESRLYHAESGAETTLTGASPDQWLTWVLEHLGTQETVAEGRREPTHPAVEVLAVEVLDVTVTEESATSAESTHRIAARVVIQLGGLSRLQRDIGSRVLSQLPRAWSLGGAPEMP
jgi:hypothetical protein